MYTLSGVSIASGVGFAPAVTISRPVEENIPESLYTLDPEAEIDKFQKKSTDFANRLRQIGNPCQDRERDILGAAGGFITDKENKKEIIDLIARGCTATHACKTVLLGKFEQFKHKDDPELIDNNRDLKNIIQEFISSLQRRNDETVVLPELKNDAIIIAQDLTPALFLALNVEKVKGVVLELGRDSGHLGLVLRELGIPAVFGVNGLDNIKDGCNLLVDGNNGAVIIEPEHQTAHTLLEQQDFFHDEVDDDSLLNVTISGAVGAIRQIKKNSIYATHGLGLLRSEFLFLSFDHEPSENEMVEAFERLFAEIDPKAPIAARTFDFADDKTPLFKIIEDENGPLTGYGAKVGSRLLKKELRALLISSVGRHLRIIFPLVTRLSEVSYMKKLVAESIKELDSEGRAHGEYEIGFMIETPSSVLCAPAFAKDCKMIIIGTSSLAEYASAPRPADIAFTPALAKMIVMAAKAAYEAGVPVGVAGRYAPRIELLPFFYKLGVNYYAVDGYQIGRMKKAVEQLNIDVQLKPSFDINLYNEVMGIFTGKELSSIINKLNIHS